MWDGEEFVKDGPRESRGGLAVCLSGCSDDEESTDVSSFDGTSAGVLTSCWLRAIEEKNLTYVCEGGVPTVVVLMACGEGGGGGGLRLGLLGLCCRS
jgi:hypothetical protein